MRPSHGESESDSDSTESEPDSVSAELWSVIFVMPRAMHSGGSKTRIVRLKRPPSPPPRQSESVTQAGTPVITGAGLAWPGACWLTARVSDGPLPGQRLDNDLLLRPSENRDYDTIIVSGPAAADAAWPGFDIYDRFQGRSSCRCSLEMSDVRQHEHSFWFRIRKVCRLLLAIFILHSALTVVFYYSLRPRRTVATNGIHKLQPREPLRYLNQ